MPWQDRIKPAAYVSPGGERFDFLYEDVAEQTVRKTTAYEFPDAEGTYIQDLGNSGRRYPLRVFFTGDDYDIDAAAFINALSEIGVGNLEHPVYGSVDVVPFGSIERLDNLKTAANQAIIDVTFWETNGLIYPTSQNDPASDVVESVEEYNAAASENFEETTALEATRDRATFIGRFKELLNKARSGLKRIADTKAAIEKRFRDIYNSINQGIETLVLEPLTLAFQTVQFIEAPARALTSIQARLDAYSDLARSIISGDGAVVKPSNTVDASNKFHTDDLYVSTYVVAAVVSSVNATFSTKREALTAAETLLDLLADVTDWRDANFDALGEVDTGAAYQKLQSSVAIAAGFLVQISFTLKQERFVYVDRNRTALDLTAELYGNVDDFLDFFIQTNDLTGSEILEIERGRRIVYYV